MIHTISTGRITLERLKEIIDNHATLVLSEEAKMAILKCRRYLDDRKRRRWPSSSAAATWTKR